MQKGTKVHVKLDALSAKRLGINGPIDKEGVIDGEYTNGVPGHYVIVDGKIRGIADKYNAITAL